MPVSFSVYFVNLLTLFSDLSTSCNSLDKMDTTREAGKGFSTKFPSICNFFNKENEKKKGVKQSLILNFLGFYLFLFLVHLHKHIFDFEFYLSFLLNIFTIFRNDSY